MVVSSNTVTKRTYNSDGLTTDFPVNTYNGNSVTGIILFDKADLQVYVAGVLQAEGTDYTITFTTPTEQQVGRLPNAQVEFTSAPAAGQLIVLVRDQAIEQDLDLLNANSTPPQDLEVQLDKLATFDQEVQEGIQRSLRLDPTVEPIDKLTTITPEANKVIGWNSVGDEVVNLTADEFLANLTADSGTITVINRDRDWYLEDFGGRGNDPTFDNTEAIIKAYTEEADGFVHLMPHIYYVYDGPGFSLPPGFTFVGQGKGETPVNTRDFDLNGTIIMMLGTGEKRHTLDRVSSMDIAGGKLINRAKSTGLAWDAQLASHYQLTDFTNADAVGTQRASLKPFSAAFHLTPGGGGGMRGIRVALGRQSDTGGTYKGLDVYASTSHSGLADDWDVGIWSQNRTQSIISDVACQGYFRLIGSLESCVAIDSKSPSSEFNSYYDCAFQGFTGRQIRGEDKYAITALTTNTIEIGWSASHVFETSGNVREGGDVYAYTGLSFAGDKLTLTGVTPDPVAAGVVVGNGIRPKNNDATGNFGFSGGRDERCRYGGLSHASRLLATSPALDTPFATASAGLIVAGDTLRHKEFHSPTVLSSEEIAAWFGDSNDITFSGATYVEGQTARSTIEGDFDVREGSQFIAMPFEGDVSRTDPSGSHYSPYPCGETGQFRDYGGHYNNSINFLPHFPSDAARFGSAPGYFKPRSQQNLGAAMPVNTGQFTHYIPKGDKHLIGPVDEDYITQSNYGDYQIRCQDGAQVELREDSVTCVQVDSTGLNIRSGDLLLEDGSIKVLNGTTSPEGSETASRGSLYIQNVDPASLWFKSSGTGNTGWVRIGSASAEGTERTISSGAIAVDGNLLFAVDTESDASTDDLISISGATHVGQIIVLRAANSGRTVVVTEDGSGNIHLSTASFSLTHVRDRIVLQWDGTYWVALSTSDNSG